MFKQFFENYYHQLNGITPDVCGVCGADLPCCDCGETRAERLEKMAESAKKPEWEKRLCMLIEQNRQRVAAKHHKIDIYREKPAEIQEYLDQIKEEI
jgi:hypothetical protein